MATTLSVYHCVIQVAEEYLGPAAHRFIDRQIQNHLQKDPEDITLDDLPTLIDWSKIALALLTDDRQIVMRYVEDLNKLHHEAKQ